MRYPYAKEGKFVRNFVFQFYAKTERVSAGAGLRRHRCCTLSYASQRYVVSVEFNLVSRITKSDRVAPSGDGSDDGKINPPAHTHALRPKLYGKN